VIRNAVIHISNEQPLVADLFALPSPSDVGLLCTNVRTLDGKRPIFIDRIDGTFFFPYLHIRFIEMPSAVDDGTGSAPAGHQQVPRPAHPAAPDDSPDRAILLPVPSSGPDEQDASGDDLEIEIDEDFLRRIRNV
jgi:hypothetical protein